MDETAVIEVDDLHRDFGDVHAVDGVSIRIGSGEVVGLLGHNGAGKTTLVRLLAGLLTPTTGRVRVRGLDPVADGVAVRSFLGVLPTVSVLDLRLSARRNLGFAAELFDLPRLGLAERIDAALSEFGLRDRADERVESLSAGMRQRLALARVLLPRPDVLLLDEPSAQLDPLAVLMVRHLIGGLSRDAGRTVVLCTHDLAEAQLLCDRVVVLDHGRVVAAGAPTELAARLAGGAVDVDVARVDAERARDILARHGGPAEVTQLVDQEASDAVTLRRPAVARAELPGLVRALAAAGIDVYGVRPYEPSLEDVYVALYSSDGSRAESGNGVGDGSGDGSGDVRRTTPAEARQ
jgi:ABC-type multidrug transport system ATPase subunit